MTYCPNKHHRRSIRLSGYDYSQNGAYFVTVCTQDRACLFGSIENGQMHPNDAGNIACQCWQDIPSHFPHVVCDRFVIMPNHIHGILFIVVSVETNVGMNDVGAKTFSPLQCERPRGTSKTIGSIVRGFKIGVTKWMRQNTPVQNVWQRGYYEHIIRNDKELLSIQQYILENPARWETDRENPDAGNARATIKKEWEELGV